MVESYLWVFRCPMCGQREPRWKDNKLSCKLGGMPPDRWFSEVGVGEIVLCSRGFYTVGYTSIVPASIINYVKAYLSEHHQAMIQDVSRSKGLDSGVLSDMFQEDSDFVVFEDSDTGKTHIMSRSQARVIHKLEEQAKFAALAKEKQAKAMGRIRSRSKPVEQYKRMWNRYYKAKNAMEVGGKAVLLDKRDRPIKESIIDVGVIDKQRKSMASVYRGRESAY